MKKNLAEARLRKNGVMSALLVFCLYPLGLVAASSMWESKFASGTPSEGTSSTMTRTKSSTKAPRDKLAEKPRSPGMFASSCFPITRVVDEM